ncbi:MAG: T9SS type B sorting domain-containing protein [Flavobacteriaceae bacterium]
MRRVILLCFCLLCGAQWLWGQLSTQHYIPPISISQEFNNNTPLEQWIYISTPSTTEVSYVIKPLGGAGDIYGSVSNSTPSKHNTETSFNVFDTQLIVSEADTGIVLTNKGYLIEAEKPIYVSVRLTSSAQAGALVSKGAAALGKKFLLGSFANDISGSQVALANFFSLLATEDNTTVQVEFTNAVVLENYAGPYPLSITLNKNETYVGMLDVSTAFGNRDGLLGAKVTSDKPIAVNTGSAAGSNGPGFGRDFGIDQIVDTDFAGTDYIFIRGVGNDSWENVMIVPTQPNTSIEINGVTNVLISGAYYEIDGSFFDADGNMFVQSDAPVVAYQGIGGVAGEEPNQGMFYVPPLSCSSRGDVNNIPLINEIGSASLGGDPWRGAIGIVAKTGVDVFVNGNLLTSGTVVSANTDYSTYLINNLNDSTYSISSNDELYVSYYTYSGPATSGSFYSGFPANPEFSFDVNLNSLGNCLQNGVELTINGTQNLDDFGWWYNPTSDADPSSWIDLNLPATTMLVPSSIGWYQVLGEINCPGEFIALASEPTFIGNCPPDSDNDGINDNIDLDNDNDGVLDQVESLGNISINFSDVQNPALSPQTTMGDTHGVSATATIVEPPGTLSFDGGTDGVFTSIIQNTGSTLQETQSYTLDFSEPVNFSFRYSNGQVHAPKSGELFSLSSVDENINISLLNPDDQLLVDTNFDGAYESGITEYTSSKIFFRFNPTVAPGPMTFEFVSSLNNGFVFVHNFSNSLETSVFNGQITINNYRSDSDADTLADAFDTDSDGDNCPDVLEAGFTDGDDDDKVLVGPLTFDDGTVDAEGLVVGHDYTQLPADNDTNGVYDFQEFSFPAVIDPLVQPASQQVCEGETAVFQVNSPTPGAAFQWQVDGVDVTDDTTFSGTTTNTLTITNAPVSLDGAAIQVLVSSPTHQCPTVSNPGVALNVNAIPNAPAVDAVYTYCASDAATIADLKLAIGGNVQVYELSNGGLALADAVALVHDQTYHISALDFLGCESITRAETEVFISNPVLTATDIEVCLGETVGISVSGVPQTAQDFENANPDFEKFLEYSGSSYFLRRESMSWEDAYTLIQSLGAGASMYVINEAAEHVAVYNELRDMGLTGTDEIHFWLGLRQIPALNSTPPTVDGGWQWLDGRLLTAGDANWDLSVPEPNDGGDYNEDGEENYGQFDFFNSVNDNSWNDMSNISPNGNSWPVFEFTGTTNVVWGKVDPVTGADVVFAGLETSTIEDTPTETTTYFYEVTTNGVTCREEITVVVHPLPILPVAADMLLCDDDTDGDERNERVQLFDFLTQESNILGGIADHEVMFYTDPTDDTTLIDKTVLFENTANPQPIYYRITNTLTGCVSTNTGQFNLRVLDLPPDLNIVPHYQCDDAASGSDTDKVTTFDLTLNSLRILGLLGDDGTQYDISYHLTAADADNPSSPGVSSYTTTPADAGQKTIYVRITDKLSALGCDYSKNQFDLIVGDLPVLDNPLVVDEECDETDGVADGLVLIDLTNYESLISSNFVNEVFTYYTSPTYDPATLIADPTSYINEDLTNPLNPVVVPNPIIYVTIDNVVPANVYAPAGSCTRFAEIDLSVGASQIDPAFNLDFFACETDPSTAQDGITTFSSGIFTQITDELKLQHTIFNAMNVSITYYPSLNDAALQNVAQQIDTTSDYNNQFPVANASGWTSEIWANVEVENFNIITCVGLAKVATLHVERLPTAHPIDVLKVCDDDNDATNDYPFDTSSVNDQLLMGQTGVTVSYWDTSGNLLFNDALPNPYLASSQTLIARVENNPSMNTPACYEEVMFEFVIDDTPDFYPVADFVLCDDSDGVINDEAVFDTRNLEADILNGQVGMDVFYYDPAGNPLSSPLPEDFSTGTIDVTVEIINPANPACPATGTVSFVVNENPDFQLEPEATLCLNEVSTDIGITAPAGTYTYTWELDGTPLPDTTEEIEIFEGGTYTVTATSPEGCTTSKSVFVLESELAQLTQETLIVSDLTPGGENTVSVDVLLLGVGDYEYALDYGAFQDTPTFENVRPGIHVLAVRDKNGCGTAYIDVSVIGYYKYFSPNNDGINDYWKVLGIDATFYNTSKVYVFDRFGRLLSQLQNDGPGWDGTFKGSPMPADDYWFRVELDDGRTFDGHFSLMR